MDEPENYAAPVTETRVNPFDAGYRRVFAVDQSRPLSPVALIARAVLYACALVGLAWFVASRWPR